MIGLKVTLSTADPQGAPQLRWSPSNDRTLGEQMLSCELCGEGFDMLAFLNCHYNQAHPGSAQAVGNEERARWALARLRKLDLRLFDQLFPVEPTGEHPIIP